ncbi:hypothetical protein [Pseudomonas simiae]|uniref:hypothetical protein n=1 Tax=Pseudomonas simiae TaxID=321846 RepID=UPI0027371430|nr:hypothetical protein [Pseudomonas simiae]WLH99836.1 hypothetical protein PSH95_20815 [Pseudomonas simiae]
MANLEGCQERVLAGRLPITEAILLISDMNIQIASAAEEQSMVAEDISVAAAEVAKEAEQTAAAREAMTELSAQQKQLAQQFRY